MKARTGEFDPFLFRVLGLFHTVSFPKPSGGKRLFTWHSIGMEKIRYDESKELV